MERVGVVVVTAEARGPRTWHVVSVLLAGILLGTTSVGTYANWSDHATFSSAIGAGQWVFTPYLPAQCPGSFDDYEVFLGTEGDDVLGAASNARPRLMFGLAGNDTLTGGNGKDCIVGGPGDDTLIGENGSDVLLGGSGDDHLDGGSSPDELYGETGDDVLLGANNDTTIDGGPDEDVCTGSGAVNCESDVVPTGPIGPIGLIGPTDESPQQLTEEPEVLAPEPEVLAPEPELTGAKP